MKTKDGCKSKNAGQGCEFHFVTSKKWYNYFVENEKSLKGISREILFLGLICLLLGAVSAWDLWEQDLFWQIRAGQDLWNLKKFSINETWSYTAQDQSWFNFQWLSNLILYFLFNTWGAPGLVLARGATVASLMFVIGKPILDKLSKSWLWCLFLLPLIYVSIFHRIQLRSELFVLLLFAILVNLDNKYWILGFLLSIVVANLHPGLLPFVLVWNVTLFFDKDTSRFDRMLPSVLCLVSFLLTPYPVKVWSLLFEHIFYYQSRILGNPEHQSFGLNQLNITNFGLTGYAWLLLTGLVAVVAIRQWKVGESRHSMRGPVLLLLFTCLGFFRDRAIPFQVIAVIPVGLLSIKSFQEKIRARTLGLLALFSVMLLISHLSMYSHQYKLRVSPEAFPIEEARMLGKLEPKGNVFHTPSYGSYLLTFAPEYRVFMDTRETPFLDLQTTYQKVLRNPADMQSTLNHYAVGAVVWPAPLPTIQEDGNIFKTLDFYFPKADWAPCHFGIQSMLLIRRSIENSEIVKACEYKFVSMDRPVHELLVPEARDEIKRCLEIEFPNISCILTGQILGFNIKKRTWFGVDRSYLGAMELYYTSGSLETKDRVLAAIDSLLEGN